MHSNPKMQMLCIGGGWAVEDLEKLEAHDPQALVPDEYEYVETRVPRPGDYYMHSTKDRDPGFPADAMYCTGIGDPITTPRLIVKKKPMTPERAEALKRLVDRWA